jgi:Zn-dependent protease with chaperone function
VYFALLSAITLAAGLILHALASLVSLGLWRIFRARLDSTSPRVAARLLFVLRMSPLALSLIVWAIFVIPSFLEFEPRATIEPLSFTLLSLAAVTAVILSGSLVRCVSAVLQSRRVMRHWLRDSRLQLESVEGVTVHRCDLTKPVVAVMGIWPARIFASDSLFSALTADEIEAAFRHEAAHAQSFDIAKKMFLQLAPSFLPGIDLLSSVSAHWSRMCELAADERAVVAGPHRTLHLASALVKVARMAASTPEDLPTLSAALHGRETLLGHRVRRLLEISEHPDAIASDSSVDFRKLLLGAACLGALLLAIYPHVLSLTHELLEFLVQG